MANQEKLNSQSVERLEISENQIEQQQEKLHQKLEREIKPDNRAEKMKGARNELEQQFSREKKGNKSRQPSQTAPAKKPIKKASKQQKKTAYKKTLTTIQKQMNPTERTFSKVIHNPVVEKTSEVVGNTIARPAPLFAGSLSALILTALVYLISYHFGYLLSGFEWIATFIIGWTIGMIIDWVRVAILGKNAGPA